jgi:hypothetical protein
MHSRELGSSSIISQAGTWSQQDTESTEKRLTAHDVSQSIPNRVMADDFSLETVRVHNAPL